MARLTVEATPTDELTLTLKADYYEADDTAVVWHYFDAGTSTTIDVSAAITTAAYVVDFNLTPRRLTPGFEKRLSKRGLFIVYATFALGLATGALIGSRASLKTPRSGRHSQ